MILHIAADSSSHIIYPFIKFVNRYFDKNEHFFILCSAKKDIKKFENGITKDIFAQEEFFIKKMKEADKIILHGLWYDKLCEVFLENRELFEKTYWKMWGGDFHFPNKQSNLKKEMIKNIKNFIVYIQEEFEYLKANYDVNGDLYKSFMYPSNIYKEFLFKKRKTKTINIQVGNSADPTNNHLEVYKKLLKYKNLNVKIFVPLVYGDEKYAKKVIIEGKKLFKDKFVVIKKRMSYKKYSQFLFNMDIAIFAHNKQQAVGNTITLLGMGKKVYMKNNTNSWKLFKKLGINVFNGKDIELSLLDEKTKKENIKKIKIYFAKKRLIEQLEKIFKDDKI